MREASFAAVRYKHPRGYELPEEKNTTPNEGDGHNGVRLWCVAWFNSRHRNDVTGSDIEVGENIRENLKFPPLLEVIFSCQGGDFQKIGRKAVVDLRGWRNL